jgi:hypothetical protein
MKRYVVSDFVGALMRIAPIFCLLFLFSSPAGAQVFTDSNLPIILIDTDGGQEIPDQPRILGTMKVIYRGEGQRNHVTDASNPAALNYNGRIEIEVRGSSSQALSKKQYGMSTLMADNSSNNNVSLLGMPREHDWVLNGLAFDASLIRDYISYSLSRSIGEYAPRTVYCEVVINGNYRGLYMLQEKIKVDENRVNIHKIEPGDNALPEMSGGYITKADKTTSEDPSAWRMITYLGTFTDFVHEFPKPEDITFQQRNYIQGVFNGLASRANSAVVPNGFPSVIDVPSFIDFMLLNELAANVDAYQFSTFFHTDRNGKLRAGPLWDLNLTYGNDLTFWGLDRSFTNTWQFDNGDNVGPKFWKDLFNNTTFRCYLSRRFNELTQPGKPFNLSSLNARIDATVALISEALTREQARWGTAVDHSTQISNMKSWLSARLTWMQSNLGSFSGCSNVSVPPLVITRIHYHPATSAEFPDSGDLEFVEITNNGALAIDLTGFYFLGTGFVYQFPAGSIIPPGGIIQLANDAVTFNQKYGYAPFGEFTRNLPNDTHRLALGDAFGNVIDEVIYDDGAPWPNADGNGMHLKLSNLNSDNALPGSWIAVDEAISTNVIIVGLEENSVGLRCYPNPTTGPLTVRSDSEIRSLVIRDTQGKIVMESSPGTSECTLDLRPQPASVYFLSVVTASKVIHYKVVKE